MNTIILSVHANVWFPRVVDFSSAFCYKAGTKFTGNPSFTCFSRRYAAECRSTAGRYPRGYCCQEAIKDMRESYMASSSIVALSVADIVLARVSKGGV